MLKSATPLLETRDLGRRHANRRDWLFQGIALRIHPGDRLAIVGPSGAGKTLVLRSLALLDPVDAGDILWQGSGVTGTMVPSFRRQVMYLHQKPALFDGSVEDNLRAPFQLKAHAGARFDRR